MSFKSLPGNLLALFLSERSAGALAAAVACGMFLGLVPALSLQAFLVIAIVCFGRVNLTWTAIALAVFKGVSVLLGGAFDRLGVVLLETPGLQGFWSALYHSPLAFLRTHEATTLGGTLLALLLCPLVYVAARVLIARRRRLTPEPAPDGGEATPTSRIFRVRAFLPMTGLFLIALGGVGMARDGIIHAAAVSGLEAAFAAKADVIKLSSELAMPTVDIRNVAVADRQQPMRNVFQFERMAGGVAAVPLLSGRVHIAELALEGLRFGTARAESGALPGFDPLPPPTAADTANAGPTFNERIDQLLQSLKPPELEDLHTVREARELQAQTTQLLARIQTLVNESSLPGRLETAKATVAGFAKVAPPESFQAVESAVRELAALRPDPAVIDAIRRDFDAAVPDFARERVAINGVRADYIAAGSAADQAQRVVTSAQKITKFSFQNALAITKLLDDLGKAQRALSTATSRFERANASILAIQGTIATRTAAAAQRLESGRAGLSDAQALLEKAGSGLTTKTDALAASLQRARADLEAGKTQMEGHLASLGADLAAAVAEAQALRTELETGLTIAQSAPARMERALAKDRDELTRRYSMDRLSSDELLAPVLGDETLAWVRWTLQTYERYAPLLEASHESDVPAKLASALGTVYRFPEGDGSAPAFWVGKAVISGAIDLDGKPFTLTGTAENVSSNLAATGLDAVIQFTAEYEEQRFTATIRVTPKGDATITLDLQGLKIAGRVSSPRISAGFEDGRLSANIELTVGPSGLAASAKLKLEGIVVAPAPGELDGRLEFLREVLRGLNTVEAEIGVKFSDWKFDALTLHASAGDDFRRGVRDALEGQVTQASAEAFAAIEARTAGPRQACVDAANTYVAEGTRAVEAFLAPVQGATAQLQEAGQGVLREYVKLEQLIPAADGDPAAPIAALQSQLAALRTTSAGLDGRAQTASAETLAALQGAMSLGKGKDDALKSVEAAVTKELARLTKLR